MFQRICEKIVLNGIYSGNINSEQKDEYIYGMNMLFDVCINVISMIIIGFIMNMLWEACLFCFVYKTIRKYSGGFHFDSALHCYIASCIMYILAILMIKYIPFCIYKNTAMTVISSVILCIVSPIEAINKPLDKLEQRVFKRRAILSVLAMIILYFLCLLISVEIAQVISISIMLVMVFAIAGKIKIMVYAESK